MVVYVEYALAENFLLDGMLLYLALRAAKRKIRKKRLFFAAALGAAFAVAFPLLPMPEFLAYLLKFAFGGLLCLVANGRGRYAATCVFFFGFSFVFAGALFALLNGFEVSGTKSGSYELARAPATFTLCGGAAFAVFALDLVKKLYRKRAVEKFTYDCEIRANGKTAFAAGFWDSGNTAAKHGTPVCFVSPDIAYDLWESLALDGEKIVCEELAVTTMSGVKTVRLFKGTLIVKREDKTAEKEVYFSPSANILSRGYKLLLHSRIFEETGD